MLLFKHLSVHESDRLDQKMLSFKVGGNEGC